MQYILEILPSLLSGAVMTLKIFIWTLIGSLPLGLVVGLGLMSNFKPEVSKLFRLASLAAEFSDKLVEISCVSN
ncbi:hypothetical protein WP50_19225 [Lactiplantibacillus plantarum]|nr:hypothetical protein WP50_19225 [Lactiplantibacillus plantarum]